VIACRLLSQSRGGSICDQRAIPQNAFCCRANPRARQEKVDSSIDGKTADPSSGRGRASATGNGLAERVYRIQNSRISIDTPVFLRKTKRYEIMVGFCRCPISAMRERVFATAVFPRSRSSLIFLPTIAVKIFVQRDVRRVAQGCFLLIYYWMWRMTPWFRTLFKFVWMASGDTPASTRTPGA
jgi:hypothetical protein